MVGEEGRRDSWECGEGVGCSSGGRESRRCRPGSLPFPLPEGEEGQEEEAGEEDKDGRWETVYACGER